MRDELLSPEFGEDDIDVEFNDNGLRPSTLDDFVGQSELKEHLEIILGAARRRGQAADHLLVRRSGLARHSDTDVLRNEGQPRCAQLSNFNMFIKFQDVNNANDRLGSDNVSLCTAMTLIFGDFDQFVRSMHS